VWAVINTTARSKFGSMIAGEAIRKCPASESMA
jgi:hypothetical protein